MIDSDQLKKKVKRLGETKGPHTITRELIIEGLSPSLAGQLVRGVYTSELKNKSAEAILKVIERCG